VHSKNKASFEFWVLKKSNIEDPAKPIGGPLADIEKREGTFPPKAGHSLKDWLRKSPRGL